MPTNFGNRDFGMRRKMYQEQTPQAAPQSSGATGFTGANYRERGGGFGQPMIPQMPNPGSVNQGGFQAGNFLTDNRRPTGDMGRGMGQPMMGRGRLGTTQINPQIEALNASGNTFAPTENSMMPAQFNPMQIQQMGASGFNPNIPPQIQALNMLSQGFGQPMPQYGGFNRGFNGMFRGGF